MYCRENDSPLRKKKIFSALFIFLSVISLDVYSQSAWGLRQCVDYAIKNNIQVKQTVLSNRLAKVNYLESKAGMLPSINGSASQYHNFGRSLDPVSYNYTNQEIRTNNFSLNSQVTLFSGFQIVNTLQQSKLEFMASEYEIKKITDDVSLNVVAAYLQVLFAEESVSSAKDRVEAASKQRDRTKLMVDAGNLAQGGLLDADALLSSEQLAEITAENLLSSSTLTLTQLLELDSANNFKIERPPVDIPDQSILASSADEIYQLSLKVLPEIMTAHYKVQSAEKGLAIARGSQYPRVIMYGTLGTGYSSITQRFVGTSFNGYQPNGMITGGGDSIYSANYTNFFEFTPFRDQLDDNLNKSIGVTLSIPIFNGLYARSNISRAKINLMNSRLSQDLTRKQVYKSIQQARLDAISSLNRFSSATKNLEAQTLALEYAEKKFNVGLLSSVDIINTRNNKSKAESDLLQAKYDLIFKIKILEFYAGKPLDL